MFEGLNELFAEAAHAAVAEKTLPTDATPDQSKAVSDAAAAAKQKLGEYVVAKLAEYEAGV